MRVSVITRAELLASLSSKSKTPEYIEIGGIGELAKMLDSKERLCCVWEEGCGADAALPTTIFVPDSQLREFRAWCVTYLEGYRPFTSLCRIINRDDFLVAPSLFSRPRLGDLSAACVGAVIGEAWTLYSLAGRSSEPTLASCLRTYSFVAGRSLALRCPGKIQMRLDGVFGSILKLVDQPNRRITVEDLASPWRVLRWLGQDDSGGLADGDDLLLQACQQLKLRQEIEQVVLLEIGGKDAEVFLEEMNDRPREERLLRLKAFADRAKNWPFARQEEASFILGYLASRIAPGSLEHFLSLKEVVGHLKNVGVWYGICAGLSSRLEPLMHRRGLGWRILRELNRWERLDDRPRADVAAEELELLRAQKITVEPMGDSLQVELIPFCTGSFKRFEKSAAQPSVEQPELFGHKEMTAGEVIRNLVKVLEEGASQLSMLGPGEAGSGQRAPAQRKQPKKRGRGR